MIRRGKSEGWLQLPVEGVKNWARSCGIDFTNVDLTATSSRGIVLTASRDLSQDGESPSRMMIVPKELVLSQERVFEHSRHDQDLAQVLESLEDFGKTPRWSILVFLLFQASMSLPELPEPLGVRCSFTDYVKTLPTELLPTFWNTEELHLLDGTTLASAISSKLTSLQREYAKLCSLASETKWFRRVQSLLDFDDWKQVDAMFRSRALDFYGSCMIPGMDIASHASGPATKAYYDRSEDTYTLFLMEGQKVKRGEEVTITYGDEKGACEMLFSYGFIEHGTETAGTLFLSLTLPENDLYRDAKIKFAGCAPGIKLIDIDGRGHESEVSVVEPSDAPRIGSKVEWDGDFIWLLCVTDEDGFRLETPAEPDGYADSLAASFEGRQIKDGALGLRRLLTRSKLWDVYRLRAVAILQQRVFDQLRGLHNTQDEVELTPHGTDEPVRDGPYDCIMKLRELEFELLEKAYEDLESQKLELAASSIVQEYLRSMQQE